MENMDKKVRIIILAAGKGKRMQSDLPKVLAPLGNKHMIGHLLESVQKVSKKKPIVVVGHQASLVESELGDSCIYAIQEEQLGTGHAVASAEQYCKETENVVVLSGDQPFTSALTIENLIKKHLNSGAKITFATAELPDFLDWRKAFLNFGRIIRKNGAVLGIREYKDATEEEKSIREVNAGCYIFNAEWLWKNLKKIKNENSQKEYYLTDLLEIASTEKNKKIESIQIDPEEALGANTKEELTILEKFAPKV